jgi:excisionase family DNA binding protein
LPRSLAREIARSYTKNWLQPSLARVTQFKVSTTIRSFILKGKIPYVKLGNCIRFYPERIMEWLEKIASEK